MRAVQTAARITASAAQRGMLSVGGPMPRTLATITGAVATPARGAHPETLLWGTGMSTPITSPHLMLGPVRHKSSAPQEVKVININISPNTREEFEKAYRDADALTTEEDLVTHPQGVETWCGKTLEKALTEKEKAAFKKAAERIKAGEPVVVHVKGLSSLSETVTDGSPTHDPAIKKATAEGLAVLSNLGLETSWLDNGMPGQTVILHPGDKHPTLTSMHSPHADRVTCAPLQKKPLGPFGVTICLENHNGEISFLGPKDYYHNLPSAVQQVLQGKNFRGINTTAIGYMSVREMFKGGVAAETKFQSKPGPIITTNKEGDVTEVRWSDRTTGRKKLPVSQGVVDQFAENIAKNEANALSVTPKPGDVVATAANVLSRITTPGKDRWVSELIAASLKGEESKKGGGGRGKSS